jgi:hypothetical protein
MTRLLIAGAAVFGMMAGSAMAETSTTVTTTTTAPVTPPTVAKTDTETTTKTYPFSNLVTTTEKKTDTVNGVGVQKDTVIQAYPPGATVPPQVTTSTRPIETK